MKNKLLVIAMVASIVAISGCSSKASQPADTKTAMQKKYKSQAECQRDFPAAGDCTRSTTTAGSGGHGGGGMFFMSPFFYPWGGVMHSNGSMSYNQRVPSSGYTAAPAYAQKSMAARTNFSRVPASYTSSHSSTVRGGFGSSARSSGGYSSGG